MKKQIMNRLILFTVIITILSFIGCAPVQKPMTDQNGVPNATPGPDNITNNNTNHMGTTRLSGNANEDGFRRTGINNDNMNVGNNLNNRNNLNSTNYNNKIGLNNNYATNRLGTNRTANQQNTLTGSNVNTAAENVKARLEARDDIERASCVISGNTALVAIDTKDGVNTAGQNKNIKEEVANMVKSIAPGVTNVAVTESPDLFERISNLSRDMQNGRTMQGLKDEFTELVNKILPTVR